MRVIIADDHPMCREAARISLLAAAPDAEPILVSSIGEVFVHARDAALVILDLWLPDSRGLVTLVDVARAAPDTVILVVSGSEQPDIERQVAARAAAGFVSKAAPLEDLIAAIRAVSAGERWFSQTWDDAPAPADALDRLASLSVAERRVMNAMRGGQLNKQIAYELDLSEITVKQHVKAILRKLNVINRTQAVLAFHAAEQGRDYGHPNE
ncbi:MAG TPA: response regulator transcription factor [Sphingomonas sp.]|nr:response regulator transcription factor [Sphingomonas sp.]